MRNNQSPTIQSIYQNALPYYLDRADIYSAGEKGEEFAEAFIQNLLLGNLNIQLNASTLAADKLRHLYFEAKNLERNQGPKTLGFGYPFYIETHQNDLFIAPLFVWYLTLEPSQNRVDSWILRHDKTHQIVPNYRLIQHLKQGYNLELLEHYEEFALNKKLSIDNLELLCNRLAEKLDLDNRMMSHHVAAAPGIDEIGALSERGSILWSGILGLFPPQVFPVVEGIQRPEEVFLPTPVPVEEVEHSFFHLPSDSFQTAALEATKQQKVAVVEGNPTSGKSQTLANLLLNALSNGKKCLVVSERVPVLQKVQGVLSKAGMNQFHFLLKDQLNDKTVLLELLRAAADGSGRTVPHNQDDFLFKLNRFNRIKSKLDKHFQAVNSKVFGQYDWTETVGLFLNSNRVEGKELLSSQLNPQEFDFTHPEYEGFKSAILSSRTLYQKMNTLKHPLSNLNSEIFTQRKKETGLEFIEKQVRKFLRNAGELQHRYISKTDAYAVRLKEHYERHHEHLSRLLIQLKDEIADYSGQYGTEFSQSGGGGFRFFSIFSSHKKQIAQAREEVSRKYLTLVRAYHNRKYFDFHFAPSKEGLQIQKVVENLNHFQETLQQWRNRISSIAQEEILRLNSKSVHPDLDYKEQISELEYALDLLIEELNGVRLYEMPLQNKTLTIPQRQKYLENIIEQLESTSLNLRDYDDFFDWQHNWLGLSHMAQKVIKALVKVKPTDWMAAFESWYFNNILTKHYQVDLPSESESIEEFVRAYHAVKPLIINQIRAYWTTEQVVHLKALKRQNRKNHQLLFDKKNQQRAGGKRLDEIFDAGIDALTSIFPILFVTPHIARHVLPQQPEYFDYLIFDEANRFSVEVATPISHLGKKMILFGSNDTYGSETSLLQYAKENGVPTATLSNNYSGEGTNKSLARSVSNRAKRNFSQEFQVEAVEGRFDEREGINDVEAQQVIRLLNQIRRTPQRVYPSVGIVCFSVEQRDLIASYLLKIKQQNAIGSDKIRQLERNGMGVFHVDEMYGQDFEVLVISFTVGTVNFKGSLTRRAIFFNTPEGISNVRLIINKVPKKTFIVHSIPPNYLKKFQQKDKDEGTFLLATYILLAKAIQQDDIERQKALLPLLTDSSLNTKMKSVFVQEVMNALSPYFDPARLLKNVPLDRIGLPLSIKPMNENASPIVVHPDGFFSSAIGTDYLWEYQQREMIENLGLIYHPVWSVRWWKNPKQEARKLASIIIKHDNEYQEKGEKVRVEENDIN